METEKDDQTRPLFGKKSGQQLRDEGAAKIGERPDPFATWRKDAQRGLDRLLLAGKHFTSEDLREQSGEPPHANCIGSFILHAAKTAKIFWTGEVRHSKRPTSHAALLKVWRGKP